MVQTAIMRRRMESLGPAERLITALTTYTDHLVHNRPGVVVPDEGTPVGATWNPATWREQDGVRIVFRKGRRAEQRLGALAEDDRTIRDEGGRVVGEYRPPGLFPEVAVWMYRQIVDVFRMDNEFVARWASWAFSQEHRDLKVMLAAFMLVQDRKGEAVHEDGEVLFYDDDFRDVGEAMVLIRSTNDLNPKLLLRVGAVLELPGIAAINRELGFGRSGRNPALGRYPKAVIKWLRHREQNPRMLEGLVRAGFKETVKDLCRKVGYKPRSPQFFATLGWRQKQAADGRRELLDVEVPAAETWEGLSEAAICERIVAERPDYKTVVGRLPASVGLTRAIMAAAIEAGALSDKDLVILTPTLEELGLLAVTEIAQRHASALAAAEDQRAANIARNVKSEALKEQLEATAETVAVKAMEAVTRDLRIYCMVDISGSMQGALERSKAYLKRLLVGFPLERLHVAVFNHFGRQIEIKAAKAAAVEQAFRGLNAGGGTSYTAGLRALAGMSRRADEDVLMLWVGDEQGEQGAELAASVRATGLGPVAFGLLHVENTSWGGRGTTVIDAAAELGIPCFGIEETMFGDDPYAVTRTLQRLIASTPVGRRADGRPASARVSLVETILGTDLLELPVWVDKAA